MIPRRWIFISPHLDDAILSCGGLIDTLISSRNTVEIWTICAGDPPDENLSSFANQQQIGFDNASDYYEKRRKEDIAACNFLGARYRHFAFLDCIYRRSQNGSWSYPSEETIFGDVVTDDEQMVNDIAIFLGAIIKPTDVVVSPMGIGNHVDHQITRTAFEKLNSPKTYYADFPYVLQRDGVILKLKGIKPQEKYQLTNENINKWINSIEFYSSQINNLFKSLDIMKDSVKKYSSLLESFVLFDQSSKS